MPPRHAPLLMGALLAAVLAGAGASSDVQPISVPLKNDGWLKWDFYGRIGVGRPKQWFDVRFDPSLDGLWLPAGPWQDPACRKHRHFNSSQSASFVPAPNQRWGTPYGPDGEPMVGWGGFEELSLAGVELGGNHSLVLASEMPKVPFCESFFDGVFGLARLSRFLPGLAQRGLIPEAALMGLWLDPLNGRGELTLGGLNRKRIAANGPTRYLKSAFHAWETQLSGISLGEGYSLFCDREDPFGGFSLCRARIVAGNHIGGPASQIRVLAKALQAKETREGHFKLASCELAAQLPPLRLTLDGQNITLPPEHYILRHPLTNECRLGLKALKHGQTFVTALWELGQVFLRNYYTIFDNQEGRIGLAPLGEGH